MTPIDQARLLSRWPETDAVRPIDELRADAARLRDGAEIDTVDVFIARLAGLRRRSARLGAPAATTEALEALVGTLEAHRDWLATAGVTVRDGQRRPGVRLRLLEDLGSPRRPVEVVAGRLGLDPANVTRALRELQAEGLVVEIPLSAGSDRRARAYLATTGVDAEITRTREYLAPLCVAAERRTDSPVGSA